jgi:anamorsin
VHIILAPHEYDTLSPRLPSLLSTLWSSLTALGLLHISNLDTSLQNLSSELTLAGFTIISNRDENGTLISQKPSFSQGASVSLKMSPAPASLLLPRRVLDPALKSSRHALWTISSPATPPIDPESLLKPEDLVRPAACEPMTKGTPRRKKACKGCTCGLAELEEEEQRAEKVVVLDGAEDGETKEIATGEKAKLAAAAKASSKATSSCGSCFLGDAFRCASCPYLGTPLFIVMHCFLTKH